MNSIRGDTIVTPNTLLNNSIANHDSFQQDNTAQTSQWKPIDEEDLLFEKQAVRQLMNSELRYQPYLTNTGDAKAVLKLQIQFPTNQREGNIRGFTQY